MPTILDGEIVLFFTDFVFHLPKALQRWLKKVGGFSNAQLDPLYASETARKYSQIVGLFRKNGGQSFLDFVSPGVDGTFHSGIVKGWRDF